MKISLRKILFIVSGTAFILLGTYVSITGIGLQLLLLLLFYAMLSANLWPDKDCFDWKNYQNRQIVSGIVVSIVLWASFYFLWRDSEKGQQILQKLLGAQHDRAFLCLTIIGAVLSLPFLMSAGRWMSDRMEITGEKNRWMQTFSERLWLLCLLTAAVGVLLQIVSIFSKETWVDEAFSLAMIRHDYAEMIELTARDVHPPLYYIILKSGVEAVQLIWPAAPAVYLAKMISFLPYGLLLIFCVTKVRRRWGLEVMGLWAVCIVAMPRMIVYGVEIRMYSYALLFVTIAYFCTDELMRADNIRTWILFTAMALAAAYTHYFALVAAGALYFMLLLHFLTGRQTKQVVWTVLSGLTVAAGYLPWLLIFIRQLRTVGGDYWIPQITSGTVAGYVYFAFGNGVLFVLCILVVSRLLSALRFRSTDGTGEMLALMGIGVPIITALIGLGASLLVRPIFIPRYLVPGFGSLWFGMIIGLALLKNKRAKVMVTVLFLVVCLANMGEFARNEWIGKVQADRLEEMLAENGETIFITSTAFTQAVLVEKGAEAYLWGKEVDALSASVYGDNLKGGSSLHEVEQWVRAGRTVCFLEENGYLSVEEFVQGSEMDYEEIGAYKAEKMAVFYELK